MVEIIDATNPLKGKYKVPGDKSISHRAAILSSISEDTVKIFGYSNGKDCLSTLDCMEKLGVHIDWNQNPDDVLTIEGKSLYLYEPYDVLDANNSGTTTRLLLGVLSGQEFFSCITGDDSLRARPMKRVVEPLTSMGAKFHGRENSNKLPLCCLGRKEKPSKTKYKLPVASAQVKSAILLAGLYCDEEIEVIEPSRTRDHTERMLKAMGVNIDSSKVSETEGARKITMKPAEKLNFSYEIKIPGDFSSAAFLIACTILKEDSNIIVEEVGINPTRTGFLQVLEKMGVKFNIKNERISCNEPIADIEAEYNPTLEACTVEGDLVANVIDELPLFAVLATQAQGTTVLKDAKELRYKETDRIKAITSELTKMGANISEKEDGFIVKGPTPLKGERVKSFDDHRIAMALSVAAKISTGKTYIENPECADISFPGFYQYFK
ncbi:3-phosphoshikimate 1-carboxyvinyltransferase [Natranaerofaba carboxydovora]|uniref:3-phosphoshikimate 1-carboxyvinyltransferase n=1 Tax=Natranaerofaba carboxydovora TaxID=2742683 RepID=UPI001F12CE8F|nr:3-phosphoshikimate 1-carboxyvinyltransferase [Natranaerofaba carboxydovora]UMZ73224.1 3-phosphoshikimate 1-carboxyvinyltransferase 1 [Natranaerofaba carboxydovora]